MNPLRTIINWYWNIRYPELSQTQVEKVFDQFVDINDMSRFLKGTGFKWASDGLNSTQLTDTFERPGQVLARKFANCGGFMRLFKEFCLHRGCYKRIVEYELTAGPFKNRWHYVSYIETDYENFSQSNLDLLPVIDENEFVRFWSTKWKKMKPLNEHRKEIGG